MNINSIYDKSIKMLDESYDRLTKIWDLPKGSISKKKINNKIYYYYQFREGKKVISHIVKGEELKYLKDKIKLRNNLNKLNVDALDNVKKNIQVIKIFDKDLSNSLSEEFIAFNFDAIPFKERELLKFDFKEDNNGVDSIQYNEFKQNLNYVASDLVNSNNNSIHYESKEKKIKEEADKIMGMIKEWSEGKIRAREISNYLIKKYTD